MQRERRLQGGAGRGEDHQGLIAAQLQHLPTLPTLPTRLSSRSSLDHVAHNLRKPGGERGCRLVTLLLGEAGIAANIGNQERLDGGGRRSGDGAGGGAGRKSGGGRRASTSRGERSALGVRQREGIGEQGYRLFARHQAGTAFEVVDAAYRESRPLRELFLREAGGMPQAP